MAAIASEVHALVVTPGIEPTGGVELTECTKTYLLSRVNTALKQVLESCSEQERVEAAVYLRVLERIQDSDFQREMARRAEDLRDGCSRLSADAVLEIDRTLSIML